LLASGELDAVVRAPVARASSNESHEPVGSGPGVSSGIITTMWRAPAGLSYAWRHKCRRVYSSLCIRARLQPFYERGCQEKFFSLDLAAEILSASSPFDGLCSCSVVSFPWPPARERQRRGRASFESPCFHPGVVTAPAVAEAGQAEAVGQCQGMVLSETRGLWLYGVVRGGLECQADSPRGSGDRA